jgi:beta-1,4-mannosyl-glycoprotein beta-1,4-N-acetylglucosaminyltransferase
MAIYDCFQYFNEDHMVDLRLNILNEYVDFFVISESTKTHQGNSKKLNFKINNFSKFKNKIKYIVADYKENINFKNHAGGESLIEQHQRNSLIEGIKDARLNDLIILSDSDEIPDLTKLNQIKAGSKFTAFSQMMFMYKLNLENLGEKNWIGSKITLKKNITTMQALRDLKFKKYPFWRIDKKNLQIIQGGWHFSFLQTPQNIKKKIQSFSHGEFNIDSFVDEEKIKEKITQGIDIFDRGHKLNKIEIDSRFPNFILKNKDKLSDWIA